MLAISCHCCRINHHAHHHYILTKDQIIRLRISASADRSSYLCHHTVCSESSSTCAFRVSAAGI
jgi:hypothetical protein